MGTPMTSPDEIDRELQALRDRTSALSAAILRISASLDLAIVLQEIVDSACALTGRSAWSIIPPPLTPPAAKARPI